MAHLEKPQKISLEISRSSRSAPHPKRKARIRTKSAGNCKAPRKRPKKIRSATPTSSARSSLMVPFKHSALPRKLGPRDVGRNKYPEGTKRYDNDNTDFLKEKIHRRARSSNFRERKRLHPVEKRQTVQETGTPNDWKKPGYYKDEVQKMYSYHNAKRKGWGDSCDFLDWKPSKPRDSRLDALRNNKVERGKSVREYGSPHSWKPIKFKYENKGGGFLDEKFWFESSHVNVDGGLSKLIEALPPQQKLALSKLPTPTGYQSKINFLKKLRDLVMREVKRIHREDTMLKEMGDAAFLDGISKEIEAAYEKELDDALAEVLEDEEELEMPEITVQPKDIALEQPKDIALDLDIIYDGAEAKYEFDDLDVSDVDDNDDDESLANKYTKLMQRSSSEMRNYQRKVLTMHSVNKLTNLIDGMENK
eukprot:246879_1